MSDKGLPEPVGIIGAGRLGQALARAVLRAGRLLSGRPRRPRVRRRHAAVRWAPVWAQPLTAPSEQTMTARRSSRTTATSELWARSDQRSDG